MLKKCWCTIALRPGRDERAVCRALAGRDRAGREHARELDLERDRAVLVEVPEEAVVVVADRRERRDHEPARAAHLARAVAPLDVAPEHADVLLVDADRVRDRQRLARGVRDDRVEVDDLAEAVAAARERRGGDADAVLAAVEGVLPVVARARVAVGHDHLRERGAIEDRALPAAVLVGDLVEHEALAGREADVHAPALPRQHAAVEREARPLGLRDLERARCRRAAARAARDVEVAALGRDRHDAVVVDPQHLEPVEVDERDHAVDRVRPLAVAGLRLDERDAAREPLPGLLGRRRSARPARRRPGSASKSVMPRRRHRRLELGVGAARAPRPPSAPRRRPSAGCRSARRQAVTARGLERDDAPRSALCASRSRITTSASRGAALAAAPRPSTRPSSGSSSAMVMKRRALAERGEPGVRRARSTSTAATSVAVSGSSGWPPCPARCNPSNALVVSPPRSSSGPGPPAPCRARRAARRNDEQVAASRGDGGGDGDTRVPAVTGLERRREQGPRGHPRPDDHGARAVPDPARGHLVVHEGDRRQGQLRRHRLGRDALQARRREHRPHLHRRRGRVRLVVHGPVRRRQVGRAARRPAPEAAAGRPREHGRGLQGRRQDLRGLLLERLPHLDLQQEDVRQGGHQEVPDDARPSSARRPTSSRPPASSTRSRSRWPRPRAASRRGTC